MFTCAHSITTAVRDRLGTNDDEGACEHPAHTKTECVLWVTRAEAEEAVEHRGCNTTQHNLRAAV